MNDGQLIESLRTNPNPAEKLDRFLDVHRVGRVRPGDRTLHHAVIGLERVERVNCILES